MSLLKGKIYVFLHNHYYPIELVDIFFCKNHPPKAQPLKTKWPFHKTIIYVDRLSKGYPFSECLE